MTDDDIARIADEYYSEDVYETLEQRTFALLVGVAACLYRQYTGQDVPALDDPESFRPATLGGVNHGWALLQGLTENLEMEFPDANFREML